LELNGAGLIVAQGYLNVCEWLPVARMRGREAREERDFFYGSLPRDQKAFFRRAGFEVQGGYGGAWRLEELCAAHSKTEWPAHNSSNAPRSVKVGKKKRKESRSLPPGRARDDTGGVGQHITTFNAPRLPGKVSVSGFGIEDFEVAVRGGLQELLIRSEEEHSLFYVQGRQVPKPNCGGEMDHIGAFQYKLIHDAADNRENGGPQIDGAQTQHPI